MKYFVLKPFVLFFVLGLPVRSSWAQRISSELTGTVQYAEHPVDAGCIELNDLIVKQVDSGETKDAEAALTKALAAGSARPQGACSGLMFSNLAAIMLNSGRPAKAEVTAEQALLILQRSYAQSDPLLLRPLQILCSARFEQGKIGSARQVFERMQTIPVGRPAGRALVHALAGSLSVAEGKDREAEAEYRAATDAFEQAGRINTAEAAAIFGMLGSVYIRQQRFSEARSTLDRASEMFASAKDTQPADLVTLLSIRATLHIKLADWSAAEGDLLHAIELADGARQMDSRTIKALLTSYAGILRKLHRRRETRSVEARLALLQSHPDTVVDLTELFTASKLHNEK